METILDRILDLILVGVIVFFGVRRGRDTDAGSPAELAGRTVLIGTFAITVLMVLQSFHRNSTGQFPDVPLGILTLNVLAILIYFVVLLLANVESGRDSKNRLMQAQKDASANPQNIEFAWRLASATLESYLDRNISQVKWIFNIAVLAMIFGLGIIGYGASLAVNGNVGTGIVTAVGGAVAQFISATFLFIYRSTMTQANSYVAILERITKIGMAVQIMNDMDDKVPDSKNSAHLEIIRELLSRSILEAGQVASHPRGTEKAV